MMKRLILLTAGVSVLSLTATAVMLRDTQRVVKPNRERCVATRMDDGRKGWFCEGSFVLDNPIKSP